MSCSLWRWTEQCEGRLCVGDCDLCDFEPIELKEPMYCPFCGKNNFEIEDEETYYKLVGQNGNACLNIRCKNCEIDMWEHTYSVKDYWERRNMLVEKWNTRHYIINGNDVV